MHLLKLHVLFIVIFTPAYLAVISIKTSDNDKNSKLADAVVEILTSCYKNRGNAVVIAGNSIEKLTRKLRSQLYSPVSLLDHNIRVMKNIPVTQVSSHKLQVYVIASSSSKTLAPIFQQIKNSPWWNHMASVLIFDGSDSTRGCVKASAILKEAWGMNLLHAKFMCLDRAKRPLLYSYNPFISRAPHPWKLVTTIRRKNNHPWALFVQGFHQGMEICIELDFEKTYDLGGYEIRVIVKNITGVWITDPNKNGTEAFDHLDGKIARLLFYALNATPNVHTRDKAYSIIPVVQGNTTVGGDVDIKSGIFDMGLNSRFPDNYSKLSYPIRESGIVVMTQYRGHMSQVAKFIAVLDKSSRIGMLVVALITAIFLKYFMYQALIPAFLNVWRICCYTCIRQIPKTPALRIYLTSLYLLMINIHGLYQGKMSALVTKVVAYPDVHTLEDIAKYDLTVYGGKRYIPFFDDLISMGRYVVVNGANCTEFVLNDYWAACVHEKNLLTHTASEYKQHVSKEPIVKLYRMYVMRPDWPLEDRINRIITTLSESGLVDYSDNEDTLNTLRQLERDEDLHNDEPFKIMTLPELRFAFSLLGIGLLFATIVFIFEIGVEPACSSLEKAMLYICKRLDQVKK